MNGEIFNPVCLSRLSGCLLTRRISDFRVNYWLSSDLWVHSVMFHHLFILNKLHIMSRVLFLQICQPIINSVFQEFWWHTAMFKLWLLGVFFLPLLHNKLLHREAIDILFFWSDLFGYLLMPAKVSLFLTSASLCKVWYKIHINVFSCNLLICDKEIKKENLHF